MARLSKNKTTNLIFEYFIFSTRFYLRNSRYYPMRVMLSHSKVNFITARDRNFSKLHNYHVIQEARSYFFIPYLSLISYYSWLFQVFFTKSQLWRHERGHGWVQKLVTGNSLILRSLLEMYQRPKETWKVNISFAYKNCTNKKQNDSNIFYFGNQVFLQ